MKLAAGSPGNRYQNRVLPCCAAKPGDLVFFKGTYDTPGMSHTGIYLGNGMMVSAGDPIKYANIHSSYWEKHLAGFGRLSK